MLYSIFMTADALRDRLDERPFTGFGLGTADGALLEVPHPEFISIDPVKERTVIVWSGKGSAVHVDLEVVTQLEPLNNKRARRRRGA
jgi:hypothetical protein